MRRLAAYLGACLLVALAPGPDNCFVLAQSAAFGAWAGLCVTAGLVSGLCLHITLAALGVAALLKRWPRAADAISALSGKIGIEEIQVSIRIRALRHRDDPLCRIGARAGHNPDRSCICLAVVVDVRCDHQVIRTCRPCNLDDIMFILLLESPVIVGLNRDSLAPGVIPLESNVPIRKTGDGSRKLFFLTRSEREHHRRCRKEPSNKR